MSLRTLFISGLPILLLLGIAAAVWRKHEKSPDRPILVVVPLLLYLVAATCVLYLFLYWDEGWDSSRLLPSVAFSRGLDVYSTNLHGVAQTTLYPPGWVLAFLPAALASSPTGVIVAGYVVAETFSMLPMLAFLLTVAGRSPGTFAAFAVFVFALTRIEPLIVAFRPHADAPGLGFGLMACCLLWAATRPGHDRRGLLLLATLLAWFSVWSKQVMAPIVPAMALWMLLTAGVRPFLRFCGYAVVSGAVVAAAFLAVFPIEGLLFNVLMMPARTPWQGQTPWNLFNAGYELLGYGWPLVVFLMAATIFLGDRAGNGSRLREFGAHVGFLPALAALFLSSTSILGRTKVGGWPNNLSPALYFLLAAVCLVIADTASRSGPFREMIPQRKKFAIFLMSACMGISLFWSVQLAQSLTWVSGRAVGQNAAQQAYDYLEKRRARDVYFPTLPLVHLMAEGEMFHFSSSVFDREVLARYPMNPEERAQYFPKNPRLVCWKDPAWGTEYVQPTYFSGYTETVRVADLPAFRCTSRPQASKPS